MHGTPHPAWFTLWRRLTEVEIHHVDLGAGYERWRLAAEFAIEWLEQVAADFADDAPPAAHDLGRRFRALVPDRPAGARPDRAITGPDRLLLAWLIGRSPGDGLTAEPAGPLPPLPAW